jgi:hypothetical protein
MPCFAKGCNFGADSKNARNLRGHVTNRWQGKDSVVNACGNRVVGVESVEPRRQTPAVKRAIVAYPQADENGTLPADSDAIASRR